MAGFLFFLPEISRFNWHLHRLLGLCPPVIAWGKFFNAGQSCIAPDYLLIHKEIKDVFLQQLVHFIHSFYGENPEQSKDYLRIVNRSNTERLKGIMTTGRIVTGGAVNLDEKYIAPTIIDDVHPDDPIMENEVFGPVLPVMTYTEIDEAIEIITRLIR